MTTTTDRASALNTIRGVCPSCWMATEPRVYVVRMAADSVTPLPQPKYIPWVAHVHNRSTACSDIDGRYWTYGDGVPQDGPVMDAATELSLLSAVRQHGDIT